MFANSNAIYFALKKQTTDIQLFVYTVHFSYFFHFKRYLYFIFGENNFKVAN